MFIYYIYAYINKKTGLPYYIGKGKNKRAFVKHKNVSTPKDKSKIVFLETNLSDVGAQALERRYIEWFGRKNIDENGILLNTKEGGDGCDHSEEHKKNMSDNLKGRKFYNNGKIQKMFFTNEVPKGWLLGRLNKPWNKGKPFMSGESNPMFGKKGNLSPLFGKSMSEEEKQKRRKPQKNPYKRSPRGPYKKSKQSELLLDTNQ